MNRLSDRTVTVLAHERGKFVCLLLPPSPTGQPCPIQHKNFASDIYQPLYNQRTACERIFSQAKEWGIERPKLRNQLSIANLNTLTYVLLNLYAWQRCRQHRPIAVWPSQTPCATARASPLNR